MNAIDNVNESELIYGMVVLSTVGQNVKLHVSDNIVKCKEKSLTFT